MRKSDIMKLGKNKAPTAHTAPDAREAPQKREQCACGKSCAHGDADATAAALDAILRELQALRKDVAEFREELPIIARLSAADTVRTLESTDKVFARAISEGKRIISIMAERRM